MYKIQDPEKFRKNIVNKLLPIIDDEKKCINLEKGIYNYSYQKQSK